LHPTQKPVELMEYLIKTYTNENDTVLDNTMGSGTTNLAAIKKIEINWNRKGKTILRCCCSEGFGVLPLTNRYTL
jgi:DNA modification methylase